MEESSIFGVSWRGILAFLVIITVCGMSLLKIDVGEPLYSLVLVVSSAYFGSKLSGNKTNGNGNGNSNLKTPIA